MPDKPQMSVGGSATTFLWHTFQVASRVIALALFASVYKQEVFIALGGHWALMIIWILLQVKNICSFKSKYKNLSNYFGFFLLYSARISAGPLTERGTNAENSFTTLSLVGCLHLS
jgi:hypothetical protein